MKQFKCICFAFVLFIGFNFNVNAEEKCSAEKIEQLKKQAEIVSMVSSFDEKGLASGVFNNNIVTIYGLPDNFFAMNKSRSILFVASDLVDGSAYDNVNYGDGKFYIYSNECPEQIIRTIELDLKKYNKFYDSTECDDVRDEIEICQKFYDTDNLSYSVFLKKLNEYKNKKNNSIISGFNFRDFIKNNIIVVILFGVILLAAIVALIMKKVKDNRLD